MVKNKSNIERHMIGLGSLKYEHNHGISICKMLKTGVKCKLLFFILSEDFVQGTL